MQNLVKEFIEKTLGTSVVLEKPKDITFGHYATPVAFSLAKELKKSPMAIADELVSKFSDCEMFEKVESVKGFDDEVFALRVEKAYYNTLNAFMTKRAQMDSRVPMHVVFKTQSFINRTLTLSVNGTKKIFKPVIRKSRNLNRRLSKKRMERINRLTDLHDGGV